jgi:uncharacterized membrane protein YdbT with pleckstrin-like domain
MHAMNLSPGSNEKLFWEAKPSYIMYWKPYLFYGVGYLFCLSLLFSLPIVATIGILFLVYKTFDKYWEVKNTHYFFSHERLRIVHGGFNKRTFEIDILSISDVVLHEPFIYQIFKLGILEIKHTQWGLEHLYLNGIKQPQKVREVISGLARRSVNITTYDYIDLAQLNHNETIKLLK